MVKRLKQEAPLPVFGRTAKQNRCDVPEGLAVYYSNGCPFTEYHNEVELRSAAEKHGIPLSIKRIETLAEAKAAPSAFTISSVFYNGAFLTHEILSEARFAKMLEVIRKM